MNTRIFYTLLSALIIIAGSVAAIGAAEGYQLSLQSKQVTVQGTGILSANSFPSGAEVYINDKLVSVTDATLYLDPGDYKVEIRRDGYLPWQKNLKIEKKLVTQTNAQLFRQAPSLTPLTFTGAKNISPSPDGQKLLYTTASASAKEKNGVYVIDLSSNFLSATKEPRQIAQESAGFDLNTAVFTWSPDNSQVLLSTPTRDVLLDVGSMNVLANLPDIGFKKKQVLAEWESQLYLRERQYLSQFPVEIIRIATESATNVYFSPDKKKLLYTAKAAVQIPDGISPPLLASNSQPESRSLQPGSTYVYDREEDKNFLITLDGVDANAGAAASTSPSPVVNTVIPVSAAQKILLASDLFSTDPRSFTASPSSFQQLQATTSAQTAQNFRAYYSPLYSSQIQWLPDSTHLLLFNQNQIYLTEYDNTNHTVVYSGPFKNNFVYPWPDGSRITLLTDFITSSAPNLYALELK